MTTEQIIAELGSDRRSGPFCEAVYFIRCGWLVKIGISIQPGYRYTAIKYPSPCDRVFVAGFVGCIVHEKMLHRAFADLRVFDEWSIWSDP